MQRAQRDITIWIIAAWQTQQKITGISNAKNPAMASGSSGSISAAQIVQISSSSLMSRRRAAQRIAA